MRTRFLYLFFLFSFLVKAQHTYFTSPDVQLLSLNPAYAGTSGQMRLQAIGNINNVKTNFWNTNAYLGADVIFAKFLGVGFNVKSQNYTGLWQTRQYDLSLAGHFKTKKGLKIVPAFQLSYCQTKVNFSSLTYGDMIDYGKGFVWNTSEISPTVGL
jgi:hypothetical protein